MANADDPTTARVRVAAARSVCARGISASATVRTSASHTHCPATACRTACTPGARAAAGATRTHFGFFHVAGRGETNARGRHSVESPLAWRVVRGGHTETIAGAWVANADVARNGGGARTAEHHAYAVLCCPRGDRAGSACAIALPVATNAIGARNRSCIRCRLSMPNLFQPGFAKSRHSKGSSSRPYRLPRAAARHSATLSCACGVQWRAAGPRTTCLGLGRCLA